VSTPTDTPDRDPVQEVRDHLEQALASLDRMREVLPPPNSSPASGGGESA
jgi:hypothetical protein